MTTDVDLFDQKTQHLFRTQQHTSMLQHGCGNQSLQLLGAPWDPNTLKCILMAAEHGVSMVCGCLDTINNEHYSTPYNNISRFGLTPALKDNQTILVGTDAILAYIDKTGPGTPLTPSRCYNAALDGFWTDVANCELDEKIRTLLEINIIQRTFAGNETKRLLNELIILMDAFNKQLQYKQYLLGQYISVADIHWYSNLYLLSLTPGEFLLEERKNIRQWMDRMQNRKSNSGKNILPSSLLPTLQDILCGQLPQVDFSKRH